MHNYRGWSIFWLVWLIASFGTFLVAEIYGLLTDNQRTLSWAIWRWEQYQPGQPITAWTAFHFLFIGALLVIFIWLIGHFGWMVWR